MDRPRKRSLSVSSDSSEGSVKEVSKTEHKEEKKRQREEKKRRKLEKIERKGEDKAAQVEKQNERVGKMVLKVASLNSANKEGVLAALCFISELISRIEQNPGDLGIRRLGKECNGYRYISNIDKGSSILQIIGFQKGHGSYLLSDGNLPLAVKAVEALVVAADKLREEICADDLAEMATIGDRRLELAQIATRNEKTGVRDTPLTDVEDKCVGCFLATACGDALGAPVDTWNPEVIQKWFGKLAHFQDLPHVGQAMGGRGVYTGDTELLYTTTQCLLEADALDVKLLSETLAKTHADETSVGRSYPEILDVLLPLLVQGKDYRRVGSYLAPNGSHHNEGLPRISATAFAFRLADDTVLMDAVRGALLSTTTHYDGVGAAFVLAKLLIILLDAPSQALRGFDPLDTLRTAAASTTCNDMKARLKLILDRSQRIDPAKCPPTVPLGPGEDTIALHVYSISEATFKDLVPEGGAQEDAGELLGVALCIFVQYWQCPVRGMIAALMRGYETNTLAAVTGALFGALHGTHWLPKCWFDQLENNPKVPGSRDDFITAGLRIPALGFDKPGKVKNKADAQPYKKLAYNVEKAQDVKRQFGQKETIYSYG